MCCRYYYDDKDLSEILEKLGVILDAGEKIPEGIISPGSESLMITGRQNNRSASVATWGFPGREDKLIFNARSETAQNKTMFRNALETRRCLLPAKCFYEWDSDKNKVTFSGINTQVIFLAGLWNLYGKEIRFTVLTTAANASMIQVHDRMPLMVDSDNIDSWLFDTAFAHEHLRREMPPLIAQREYEQMTLK